MVKHPIIDEFEVFIRANGSRLPEYDDDEELAFAETQVGRHQAAVTISKYIEAVTGAEFSINMKVARSYIWDSPRISMRVKIDGVYQEGRVIRAQRGADGFGTLHGLYRRDPAAFNKWKLQKFRFAELEITSDEAQLSALKNAKSKAEKVGLIEIKVYRCSNPTPTSLSAPYANLDSDNEKFHEKVFKGQAKSHKLGLSPATPTADPGYVEITDLDSVDYPIAIFHFKYRSRESLKQLLIIERTPEPEESLIPEADPEIDLNNLTSEQRERVKAFLLNEIAAGGRASNTPSRKIKRERDNGEGSSSHQRNKKSKKSSIPEVIDLISDSDE